MFWVFLLVSQSGFNSLTVNSRGEKKVQFSEGFVLIGTGKLSHEGKGVGAVTH